MLGPMAKGAKARGRGEASTGPAGVAPWPAGWTAIGACVLAVACGAGTSAGTSSGGRSGVEPSGPAVDDEDPRELPSPRADLGSIPRCEAETTAPEGLDPAPSVHDLPAARATVAASGPSRRGEPRGGDAPGFVWWTSDNGRLSLLMRFTAGPPRFGHHGEVGAEVTAWLVDHVDGRHEAVDEMIAAAATAIAVRATDGRVVLVREDGERTDLSALGADDRSDANRCLNRRPVSFDPTSRFAAWLARDPAAAVVRDLTSGAQCRVEARAPVLWRAYPGAVRGWALLREIPADSDGDGEVGFPVQRTSCACRWCNRFALSYGFYGWGGDAFESVLVAPDGGRVPVEGPAHPVGDATAARVSPRGGRIDLVDAAGQPVTLPTGCDVRAVAPGASSVLLRCGDDAKLFFPENGRTLDLPARVEASGVLEPHVTEAGHVWVAVRASRDGTRRRLSRLRMNDGRIELGPEADELAGVHAGWAVARRDGGLVFVSLVDGFAATTDVDGVRHVHGLVARLPEGSVLIAPRASRHLRLDVPVDTADASGCALVPAGAGDRGVAQGPWRRVCP